MYIILSWPLGQEDEVEVVTDSDGFAKLFKTREDALVYGENVMNWEWMVVELKNE